MDYKKILIQNRKYILNILIILLVSFTRLLPHPPNVSPITAIALFSGSTVGGPLAFVIPLFIMITSDIFLGFHVTIPFVYMSFIIITSVGFFLKKQNKAQFYVFASLFSSFLFYIVTNFGVWLLSPMYQKNINGLFLCYAMGIPFFRNTVIGDIIYTIGIFYGYKLITLHFQRLGINRLFK